MRARSLSFSSRGFQAFINWRRRARRWSTALLLAGCCWLGGCGGSDGPELAAVTGTVTLDGTPLKHAVIRFLPDGSQGTTGPTATALLDESGHYTLLSPGQRPGAVAGFHLVTLICDQLPVREVSEGVFENVTEPCLLPDRFASEETSGLTAEVTAGEDNVINFDLKSEE